MPFPISIVAGWLLKNGVDPKATGPLAWVLSIIVAIVAIILAISLYNAAVIDDYETEKRADEAEKTIEQIEEAEEQDERLRNRDDQTIDNATEGARNAATKDPEGAGKPVGPVTSSVHDSLREQR